jgi:hypothetical protein
MMRLGYDPHFRRESIMAANASEVNLNTVRRHDATASDIVETAGHVVVYRFDSAHSSWVRPNSVAGGGGGGDGVVGGG